MKARALIRMLNRGAQVTRSGSRPLHKHAHMAVADGILSLTVTDGFRLLRQADVMDAPDDALAVDLEEARLLLTGAVAEMDGDPCVVLHRVADGIVDVTLTTPAETRIVRLPIAQPSDAERAAWRSTPTLHSDLTGTQWASVTDAAFARKALAALTKHDRCYLHLVDRWLNVWRHSDVTSDSAAGRSTTTQRAVVMTASAPDAVLDTRVRVNPQWLLQASKWFLRTFEIGVTRERLVLADRRTSPLTMVVIMGMRAERGDA